MSGRQAFFGMLTPARKPKRDRDRFSVKVAACPRNQKTPLNQTLAGFSVAICGHPAQLPIPRSIKHIAFHPGPCHTVHAAHVQHRAAHTFDSCSQREHVARPVQAEVVDRGRLRRADRHTSCCNPFGIGGAASHIWPLLSRRAGRRLRLAIESHAASKPAPTSPVIKPIETLRPAWGMKRDNH